MWGSLCESYRQSLLRILEAGDGLHHAGLPCERVPRINDNAKVPPWEQVQNVQSMEVASWAKLFHTTAKEVDWIIAVHRLSHGDRLVSC